MNIQINRFIGLGLDYLPGGENREGRIMSRPWNYESKTIMPWGKPSYEIPDDGSVSAWRVMRDISRRYPEQILAVKQFGFPFQADATLVFANPNDVYVGRMALHGEAELGRFLAGDSRKFAQWWKEEGKTLFVTELEQFGQLESDVFRVILEDAHLNQVAPELNNPSPADPLQEIHKLDKNGQMLVNQRDPKQLLLGYIDQKGAAAFQEVIEAMSRLIDIAEGQVTNDMDWYEKLVARQHAISRWIGMGRAALFSTDRLRRAQEMRNVLLDLSKRFGKWCQDETKKDTGKLGAQATIDRYQPVRRWHLITSDQIVHNGITLNDKINNAVRIDDYILAASESIPHELQRILDVIPSIVLPKKNVDTKPLRQTYAQSFLKDEVAKMYRGELVLLGIPEIEPFDVILLFDTRRGMFGPVEVESVIHEFNQESGYITIVKPKALVLVNETLGAGIMSALWDFGKATVSETQSFFARIGQGSDKDHITPVQDKNKPLGQAATAATATGSLAYGSMLKSMIGRMATKAGISARMNWIGLALLTYGGAKKVYALALEHQGMNPLFILPLVQFDRPWVAGLQGFKITDLIGVRTDRFEREADFVVWSTIEGFRQAAGIAQDL
jgi:hypothetical protein